MLRLLLCPALLLTLTSCLAGPDVRVSAVSLLAAKTEVADNAGNAVAAIGYLKTTLISDADLEGIAAEHDAGLWYAAETCETHVKLGVWPYLLSNGENSYTALVAYKDSKSGSYNLASRPEGICMTVGVSSMNPLANVRSRIMRYAIPDRLTEELRLYETEGGVVDLKLSPDCQAQICRPTFKVKKRD